MNPIPLWVRLLAIVVCVVLLAGAVTAWRSSLIAQGDAQGEARERAAEVARQNTRLTEEAARRAQLDRQKEDSDRETRRMLTRAQDERAVADAAAGKLRVDLAAYVAAAKRADPAPVGQRPAADSALDLLANLYARADEEAGILADYADHARIAGEQCERDFDALRSTQP
jgi:hypothetical protein